MTFIICHSTGAEIGEPGRTAWWLAIDDGEKVETTSDVWESTVSIDDVTAEVSRWFGLDPEGWRRLPADEQVVDPFGSYPVASITVER